MPHFTEHVEESGSAANRRAACTILPSASGRRDRDRHSGSIRQRPSYARVRLTSACSSPVSVPVYAVSVLDVQLGRGRVSGTHPALAVAVATTDAGASAPELLAAEALSSAESAALRRRPPTAAAAATTTTTTTTTTPHDVSRGAAELPLRARSRHVLGRRAVAHAAPSSKPCSQAAAAASPRRHADAAHAGKLGVANYVSLDARRRVAVRVRPERRELPVPARPFQDRAG